MEQKEFEIEVGRIRPRLHHEAMRYVSDAADAEDIAQEVVLKLWVMHDRLEEYRSTEALAVVMARRLSLNKMRKATVPLAEARPADSWPTVRLVGTSAPGMAEFCGETFDRIAARCKLPPAAVAVRLLSADAAGTTAGFRGMSEENLRRIIALDYCACGSDENARPADGSLGSCHPRAFTHNLRLRLDATSSIEPAVRQVTAHPAVIIRLADAGTIAPGKPADLAAFDPETIDGTADFLHPHTPASGILFTLIGGEFVYRNGSGR